MKSGQLIFFPIFKDNVNKSSLFLSSITICKLNKSCLAKISSLRFGLLQWPFNPSSVNLFSNIVCKKVG